MAYWLLKTEPDCWSWQDQVRDVRTPWDGVRNFQAQKHMRAMREGDEAFFYHTGGERRIMGTVKIVRAAYPDTTDPNHRFSMVDVRTLHPFAAPVTLDRIKQDPRCHHLALIKQGRLSVVPIDEETWQLISSWGHTE